MKRLLVLVIRIYQKFISPLTPSACIYYPTCSEYSLQAINKYGVLKGGAKSIHRILRCHPFGRGGHDPLL